ncbi:MAG: hypothetical protein IIV41_03810 [Akkermansia sp.]|nr:hypothetical protein [Akkermansia sp.]
MAQKTVDIHVEAEGMDLTYQWYRNMATTDAATGETVYKWQKTYLGGYDTDTMSFVANAARCGEYRCVITDGSGALVYSKVIKVSLIDKELVLLSQPEDVEVERRGTVTFTCEADGIDVKYQWFASSDEGETWVETYMDGYNTNELTFTATAARTAKLYKCVITDVGNNVVETEAVSATMK